VRDVDAPRRDIGGHQVPELALARGLHHLFAFALRQIAVEPCGAEALAFERLGDTLGLRFGVAENERAFGVLDLEHAQQGFELVAAGQVDEMKHLERPDVVAGEREKLRLLQPFARDALDVRGDGGREEQRLAIFREPLEDARELALEAHREHLVGLVQHQHADAFGVEGLSMKVIEHAAGRSDDDLCAGRELLDLAVHGGAAVDGDGFDASRAAETLEFGGDLKGELAGRAEHQHLDFG
jgi:hypothetical protein